MIENGYTLRWRKRWKYGLEKTDQGRLIFILMDFLIDEASFADGSEFNPGIGKVEYKRGEVVTSERDLANRFGVDRQRIRTCLKWLQKMEFSTHTSTHRETRIFIINYDAYQTLPPATNPQTDQQLTQRKPTANPALYIRQGIKGKKGIHDERDAAAPPSPPISILGIQKTKTPKLIPDDLALTPQMIDHATGLGIENVQRVFESFKAHHANKGTRGLSWGQGWITWCGNETKFKGGNGGAPRKTYAEMQKEINEREKRAFLEAHKEDRP